MRAQSSAGFRFRVVEGGDLLSKIASQAFGIQDSIVVPGKISARLAALSKPASQLFKAVDPRDYYRHVKSAIAAAEPWP